MAAIAYPIYLIVVVGLGVSLMLLFNSYCSEIARLEGRTHELNEKTSDDGAMNRFQREQYRKVIRRQYRLHDNEHLIKLGEKLFIRFRAMQLLTVGLVFFTAYVFGAFG